MTAENINNKNRLAFVASEINKILRREGMILVTHTDDGLEHLHFANDGSDVLLSDFEEVDFSEGPDFGASSGEELEAMRSSLANDPRRVVIFGSTSSERETLAKMNAFNGGHLPNWPNDTYYMIYREAEERRGNGGDLLVGILEFAPKEWLPMINAPKAPFPIAEEIAT